MTIRFILLIVVLIAAATSLVFALNSDSAAAAVITRSFTLGQAQFSPAQVLLGFLAAGIFFVAGKLIIRFFDSVLFTHGGIHPASREAISTISSYAIVVVSAFIGLGVAGFTVTNFAIVAGALSVGIGFGLQNIVNNFISGLILLVEQPVRMGDYIRTGSFEGHVRRVRIRFTEIETLDRQSVIVPNSNLISDSVINYNLRDNFARISISIGVAYGSDTEHVKALMLQAAHAHPSVLPERGDVPPARVLLTDFADSSLSLSMYCYVADAGKRMIVASDIRYEIDKLFRQHAIQIPFPQRDLHVVSDIRHPDSSI